MYIYIYIHDSFAAREFSVLGDYLANFTIDNGQSCSMSFGWPFADRCLSDCNLVAWSDGGTRPHRCSASAWFVEVGCCFSGSCHVSPLALGRTYFQDPISPSPLKGWQSTNARHLS